MMTPTLLNACLASSPGRCALRRLRQVILCGETVTDMIAARARQALPEVELYNLYSIAECGNVALGNLYCNGGMEVDDFAQVCVAEVDGPMARIHP